MRTKKVRPAFSSRPASNCRATCILAICLAILVPLTSTADASCDMSGYKEGLGPRAELRDQGLQVSWSGEDKQQWRLTLGVVDGVPTIREMSARRPKGSWLVLARNARPEFQITTGKRRISEQQLAPLRKLGLDRDPGLLEQEKWKVFWDAPLVIPGVKGTNPDLPRRPEEIKRSLAEFHSEACKVKTEGIRLEVSYPGVSMGSFSGSLQFTFYQGTNLVRMELVAKTDEPSVAYHYRAGLKGFRIGPSTHLSWRDVARGWQRYEFGGAQNEDPVSLRARNRLLVTTLEEGSLAVFPPPHKFFFGREIEMNLGYVWYRKDDASSFSLGIRQADREEMYRPFGFADEVWQRRSEQARSFATGNFALFNAPPGTWQHMAIYLYPSAGNESETQAAVLKYTHDDQFKPVPGFQVAISHFHTAFHEQLLDAGSLDYQPPWVPTFRALGINIAMMSDFHGDGHPQDPGPLRFSEQRTYFEGSRRHSDKDFLIIPGEEPNAYFGGHYTMVFPRPVYWSHVREGGQEFVTQEQKYGKTYHVGSAADELRMLEAEHGLVWQSHPRTKGSSGYPDAIRETEYFRSDRFLGASFQSLPVDLSEKRLCETRCLGTLDDMNNWSAPKYLVSEGDTYAKFPEDETYPHLLVNYIRLARLPAFDEDWSPILQAMRDGDYFVSSGEVIFRDFAIEGQGNDLSAVADLEWTYPLEFVELVWGDGEKTDRKVISTSEQSAFGRHRFRIPFEASKKKWVRLAAWDSAGNGALWQPVALQPGVAKRK